MAREEREVEPSALFYIQEIKTGEYDPVTRSEEAELLARLAQGDQLARERIIKAHLRFVVMIAHQYLGDGLPLADLINAGNLGLIEAVRRFNKELFPGTKFITYAVWWIRQAILKALSEEVRTVRLPTHGIKILAAVRRLTEKYGLSEWSSAFSEVMEEDWDEPYSKGLAWDVLLHQDCVSLDQKRGDSRDDQFNLYGLLPQPLPGPDQIFEEKEFGAGLKQALGSLEDREAEVITLYFGLGDEDPMTLEEIGVKIGLTKERVRQIRNQALLKLRRKIERRVGRVSG